MLRCQFTSPPSKTTQCRQLATNVLVQQPCKEEEFGFMYMWGCFVGSADKYTIYGMLLCGKGAAVFPDKLYAAFDSCMDNYFVTNIV